MTFRCRAAAAVNISPYITQAHMALSYLTGLRQGACPADACNELPTAAFPLAA